MLSGKTVVVTGAGHGVGEAVAIELGRYGANVAVNDLGTNPEGDGSDPEPAETTAEAVREAGGNAITHFGDASSMEEAEELITRTYEEFERVDGIANFAGIVRNDRIADLSRDDWNAVIDVHLGSHFAQLRALVRHAEKHDLDSERSFLGTSSGAAVGGYGQLAYSTAKAGVLGFVRSASDELRDSGIRVNALVPGAESRQNSYFPASDSEDRSIPGPEHIGPTVGFLMSDEAEGVNGLTIRASGEMIGLVSDPQATRLAFREDGWTPDTIAERFHTTFGEYESLDRKRYPLE
ncbi:SDR family NAD(P)-dependent oxidoreductase [Natronosalvus rutilus]|uniref:SDR family oxidoreductase n=1 Tax=Natronosalvus rutilus TaxID=2953753 RepID=A0A9E7NEQ7_9EURY|nr:SDR family NAD(P)-dependent oxidoreductase [Natronosalvus rutilus]UTF55688.1 SDR family oxidoreductase [Natronosalvus rutilus]